MSTAPPGWHRQPDGRDRFWDGQRWTDEFRDPSDADTAQIPLDETRGMPAAEGGGYASQAPGGGSPGGQGPYAPPSSYGDQPYAYGEGGGPLADQQRGSGWLKGCLIALLVVVILVVLVVVAGALLLRSASDEVAESIPTVVPTEVPTELPTDVPTDLPTGLPTDLPTALPTDLPTDLPTLPGQGESAEAGIGEEFTLGPATIQSGWSVEEATLGFATLTMRAVPSESGPVPMIFEIVFYEGDTDITRTTCTVPLETVGEAADVVCVPVRGYTEGIDRIQATALGTG
jgi:hypothetical protein